MYSSICLSNCWLFKRDKTFHHNELQKYFNESERRLIMELLKRYMDDGFIFWPIKLNAHNNMHTSMKLTTEKK